MELFVNLAEVGVGDVGVDLSGGNVGVAEERLNGAEVGAVHEEVGGEGMAESVGGDVLGNAGGASMFLNNTFDGARGEATVIARGVDSVEIARIVKKESGEGILAHVEIFADTVGSSLGDENWAVFLAFTTDDKFATVEVDGVAIEIDKLGDAEPARKEELDDSAVAETGFGIVGDGVEQVFDFVVMKEGDLLFDGAREVDEGRVERFDIATGEVFEKTAEGDEMISLSDGLEVFSAGVVDFVTIEAEAELAEDFGVELGRLKIRIAKDVGENIVGAEKVEAVIFDGFFRTTALDFEMFEKIVDELLDIHKVYYTLFWRMREEGFGGEEFGEKCGIMRKS